MKFSDFIAPGLYALLIIIDIFFSIRNRKTIKEHKMLMLRILNWNKGFEKWRIKNQDDLNAINKLNQSLFDEIDELRNKINKL